MKFVNPTTKLIDESDNVLVFRKDQEIPQWLIDENKQAYDDSTSRRSREFERYASIPVTLYYKWMDEGFIAEEHSKEEVVARLRRENLHAFITSSKVG